MHRLRPINIGVCGQRGVRAQWFRRAGAGVLSASGWGRTVGGRPDASPAVPLLLGPTDGSLRCANDLRLPDHGALFPGVRQPRGNAAPFEPGSSDIPCLERHRRPTGRCADCVSSADPSAVVGTVSGKSHGVASCRSYSSCDPQGGADSVCADGALKLRTLPFCQIRIRGWSARTSRAMAVQQFAGEIVEIPHKNFSRVPSTARLA